MGTFCLAKKDVSRENKLRWRGGKREVAEQPRRKELSMVGVGGALATSAAGEKPEKQTPWPP